MAQNNKYKAGTSLNISEYSLKEIPFSAVITAEKDYQIQILEDDGESLNYISGYKLSLTSSEKNIKNIKSVIWRQNYGTPVDVYQEDLNYIFTTVDSSSVKITAEVTPYIGEKYFTSILIKPKIDNPLSPSFCEGASDRLQINTEIHNFHYFNIYETQSNDLPLHSLSEGFLEYNTNSPSLSDNSALYSDIIIDYFGVIQNFGEETKKLIVQRDLNPPIGA